MYHTWIVWVMEHCEFEPKFNLLSHNGDLNQTAMRHKLDGGSQVLVHQKQQQTNHLKFNQNYQEKHQTVAVLRAPESPCRGILLAVPEARETKDVVS